MNTPNPTTAPAVQASAQLDPAPPPTPTIQPDRPRRRSHKGPSLFWPVLLIGAGIAFLLSNTGMLPANWWINLWRFWPVLLILAGLDILFGRRSGLGALFGLVLGLFVIGSVFGLIFYNQPNTTRAPWFSNFSAPSRTHAERRTVPLAGAQQVELTLDLGMASTRITPMDDSADLLQADLDVYGDLQFDVSGESQKRVHLADTGFRGFHFPFSSQGPSTWAIRLNQVPTYDLKIHGGFGSWDMDLSRLKVERLDIAQGFGSSDLSLPESGQLTGSINGGFGSIRLHLPAQMEARIDIHSGFGSVHVDDSRFTRSDTLASRSGVYQTEGYSSNAPNRIDLNINGGFGSIHIR